MLSEQKRYLFLFVLGRAHIIRTCTSEILTVYFSDLTKCVYLANSLRELHRQISRGQDDTGALAGQM